MPNELEKIASSSTKYIFYTVLEQQYEREDIFAFWFQTTMFFRWLKYLGSNEDPLQTAEREVLSCKEVEINCVHTVSN